MGDGYVKSDENQKIVYSVANNWYRYAISEYIPYNKLERWRGHPEPYLNKLEDILNTPDGSDIGYFSEVDIKYSDEIKENTKVFLVLLKVSPVLKISLLNI